MHFSTITSILWLVFQSCTLFTHWHVQTEDWEIDFQEKISPWKTKVSWATYVNFYSIIIRLVVEICANWWCSVYLHTFWKLFIYISYIVRTIFPSIWCFCNFISNTYHFVFMYNYILFRMKFASNSYAFQIVLAQNYLSFFIGLQQNSHMWIHSHTFWVIHIHFLYIVHTIFPSIWYFCDFISNTYHFVFTYNFNIIQMKFASNW